MTQGWVSQTLKTYRQQGDAGLTTDKRSGAPSRLTADQLDQLTKELANGAEQRGFAGQVWTRPRINEVITKLFGWSAIAGQLRSFPDWTSAQKGGLEPTETNSTSSPSDRRSGRIRRP